MRIGYDITAIGPQPSGVGTYALQLLTSLAEVDQDHEYLLLSNRSHHKEQFAATPALRDLACRFPSRMLWMQLVLPAQLSAARPDLCHYPNSIGPLRSPTPYVVTIHDMTLSMMPRHHPLRKQLLVRPLIPLIARRAARVITVSAQARADIVRVLRIPPERVAVIPEAAAPIYRPAPPAEQARVRETYGLRKPFVLYVGTLEPRKNLVRLIRAWASLRRGGAVPHQLVFVGAPGWHYRAIYEEAHASGYADDVIFAGYLPRSDLPALYSAADAFAFPSLAEGFGLPVIEAMACGTPTLISATPALREVAGEAALCVDPRDVAAIATGLEHLLTDRQLHATLGAAGLARASAFSWHRAARETLAVYGEALEAHTSTLAAA